MALSEAVIAKNLEEIESELELLRNAGELRLASSIRSKISFVKSLLAAEFGGRTPDRLNHFVAQLSALESALDEVGEEEEQVEQPKKSKTMEGMGYVSVRRNLEELEAMVHTMALEPPTPFWSPNAEKIRRKICFTKSLLSAEDKDEQFASMTSRLAAVEEASARWVESSPLSCSCTSSCYTEDVEVEEEAEVDGDADFLHKTDYLKSNLAGVRMELQGCNDEMEGIIETHFVPSGQPQDADANAGDESSPCVCTSSCFEDEVDGSKKEQVEVYSTSHANETALCSLVTNEEEVEANSDTIVSLQETREVLGKGNGNDKKCKFGKFRAMGAMLAVFCVAVAGIVFQNFVSEGQPVYLVPT